MTENPFDLAANSRMAKAFKRLGRENVVKKTIVAELQDLIPKSKHYQHELDTAKTDPKKRLMKKRLTANNKKVADLFMALQRLEDASGGLDGLPKKLMEDVTGDGRELSNSTGRVEAESTTEKPVD